MDEITEIWGKCRPSLQESVSDVVWKTCLSLVTPVKISGDNLTLGVPSPYVRSKVAERFLGLVRDAASGAAGRPLDISLVIVAGEEPTFDDVFPVSDGPTPAPSVTDQRPSSIPATPAAAQNPDGIRLDPRFTFETFVSAQSNRMALAAAQTVAESPGRSYNPLFIYGGSGLGVDPSWDQGCRRTRSTSTGRSRRRDPWRALRRARWPGVGGSWPGTPGSSPSWPAGCSSTTGRTGSCCDPRRPGCRAPQRCRLGR